MGELASLNRRLASQDSSQRMSSAGQAFSSHTRLDLTPALAEQQFGQLLGEFLRAHRCADEATQTAVRAD